MLVETTLARALPRDLPGRDDNEGGHFAVHALQKHSLQFICLSPLRGFPRRLRDRLPPMPSP